MTLFAYIYVAVWVALGMAWCLLITLWLRNHAVCEERKRVVNRCHELGKNDPDWRRYYRVLDEVSYDAMLYQFWRSFDSFWPAEYRKKSA